MPEFVIKTPRGERVIGSGHPAFIVAEMSANHGQNFDRAVAIVKAAAKAGADAIKLQTYTPDTMTIDSDKEWFLVRGKDNPESWKGRRLYNLYKEAYTPWEWHRPIQKVAEELGLVFFSTPFDATAVDFLETLNVPLYKIASYEVTDIPLLKKVASTRKPVIISTGFASFEEVSEAVSTLRQYGSGDISVLHCVTSYSQNPVAETTNLNTMLDIQNKFNVVCGFSDNNAGIEIPLQAALMGGSIIEKHLVYSSDDAVLDSNFSVNPSELERLVNAVRRAECITGRVQYGVQNETEQYNSQFRRSVFVTENIQKGELLTINNIRVIRPAFGLKPKYYDQILGKRAAQYLEKGTPLQWDHLTDNQTPQ